MKFYTSLVLLLSIFLTISCSKDDSEIKKGEILFENNSYELNNGYINFRPEPDFNIFSIHLSNDNTMFTANGRRFGENSKTTIDLTFFNDNKAKGGITNYYPLRYNNFTNEILTNETPYLVGSAINFNLSQKNGDWNGNPKMFIWKDGSATIKNVNGEYKITFTLKNKENIITGRYIGPLKSVDYF